MGLPSEKFQIGDHVEVFGGAACTGTVVAVLDRRAMPGWCGPTDELAPAYVVMPDKTSLGCRLGGEYGEWVKKQALEQGVAPDTKVVLVLSPHDMRRTD